MKAVQMTAIKKLQIADIEEPIPENDEVLLKIMAVGVCGSDIPRINKFGPHVLPLIPGHEFAGEIVTLGRDVKGWKVGDHVCVAPLIPCNQCKWCKRGEYSLCENYQFYGSRNDGAMAEYLAVKAANLVKLKDNIPFDWGATVEPVANAIHSFLRGNVTNNDTLCVFGMGPIGLFAVQYGKALGIKTVIAVDINDTKLDAAKSCGADFVINSRKEDVISRTKELTDNEGVSAVMEMSGAPVALMQGIQVAKKMGRVILLGISHTEIKLPEKVISSILRNQLSIIGSWNSFSHPFPGQEWIEAVKLMSERKLNPGKVITHQLELADVPELFRKIDEEPFQYNKIIIYPTLNGQ